MAPEVTAPTDVLRPEDILAVLRARPDWLALHAGLTTPDCATLWPHPLVAGTAPATRIVVLPAHLLLIPVSPACPGGLRAEPDEAVAVAVAVPLPSESARYWYHGGEHLEEVLAEALATVARVHPDRLAAVLGRRIPRHPSSLAAHPPVSL
jgi:hypothetical protein